MNTETINKNTTLSLGIDNISITQKTSKDDLIKSTKIDNPSINNAVNAVSTNKQKEVRNTIQFTPMQIIIIDTNISSPEVLAVYTETTNIEMKYPMKESPITAIVASLNLNINEAKSSLFILNTV